MYRRWISALVVLLLLAACGGSAAQSTAEPAGNATGGDAFSPEEAAAPAEAPAMDEDVATDSEAAGGDMGETGSVANSAPEGQSTVPFGRMVIRTATLSLLVTNADDAERQTRTIVQNVGGFVLESQTSGDQEQRSVRLTVKVPVANFDQVLNALEDLAIKVQGRSVSGQDVTDEFVDTESRLRNLRATEQRLLEFLEEADTVEEALLVNQQLTDLQGQIEQASGRIKFLQESVAFSTISVDLNPDIPLNFTVDEGWSPRTAASRAWRELLQFSQGLADLAISLAIWSPVWGIMLFLGLVFWRRLGRRGPPPQTTP
jgi:hypothetical protein